ncbi:hypothetical protein BH23ACT6_BH23ACT6_10640 [soil metagenome]
MARLTGAPKHYLADPALAARLLGVGIDALLAGTTSGLREGALLGALFEHLVAIETKLTRAVGDNDVRHVDWLEVQVPDLVVDRVVVTTGQFAYRRRHGVAVIPAGLLGP